MAGPVRQRVTAADRRHFDFVQTLIRISNELTEDETANVKLFCMHLIPKGQAARISRAVDVFHKLIELDKIDQENLDFLEELLERMERRDLIRAFLRPFLPPYREIPENPELQPPDREIPENPELQPPYREIPENPELQPGTSAEGASGEADTTSNAFVVFCGQRHMIQETVTHQRRRFASLFRNRRSQVKFRGYKKHKSILVHYTVPRENTAVLRHMADHSDLRLVFMGVESLQIDDGVPIKLQQEALLYDVKRQLPVDDIEVGCSTRKNLQRAPKSWTRLWALDLFSDALPLHLQVAESLEIQGFSYSLVRALAERDRLREHQLRRAVQNLRKAEADSNTLRQKAEAESNTLRQKAEADSNTVMTLRSKLIISENLRKQAVKTNAVLEEKLQQAQEYAEKAAKQLATRVTEYRGEKPPGGWPGQVDKTDSATQTYLADTDSTTGRSEDVGDKFEEKSMGTEEDSKTAVQGSGSGSEGKEEVLGSLRTEQDRPKAELEGAAPRTTADLENVKVTFGGEGTEPGKYRYPRGVVVSPSNEIFVADSWNRRVQIDVIEGRYLRHFPTVVAGTEDKDMEPYDVCMDSNGTLWVVGSGDAADYVVQYSTDGTAMAGFHLQKNDYFRGIAVDMRTNHILVTDAELGEVQVFRPDGSLLRRFGHPGGEMREPEYIAVDGEGNILVSDWSTHFVYVYDVDGKFLFQFGGRGSEEGQLVRPNGICTDSSGHIIVADSGNERVQIFTRHGEYVRTISTGSEIHGLAVGPKGQLVVVNGHHTVTVLYNY